MKALKYVLSFLFLIAAVGLVAGCQATTVSADDSYVTLDINPSIELIVTPKEKVIYANPLNEDGELLLLEIDIIGLDLEEATEIIIDKAIELGFIDVDSEEVYVSVSTINMQAQIGETIQNRVKEAVNEAFKNRAMMGKAVDKDFGSGYVEEANSFGVTPGFYRLAQSAVSNSDLTLEEALAMTQQELMDLVQTTRRERREVSQMLKDEFFAARQLLFDEYLPQIEALEQQILESTEDTTELEAQLEALEQELHDKVALLRDEFHAETEALRAEEKAMIQNRVNQFKDAVEQFRNQMQQRRGQVDDEIDEFQGDPNKRP
ncbi:MAG: hypothetical protein PHW37_04850 [Acholeplasmataceae bacterium]|nr:hypothetical protein [Acholeplasmataceae bacterium]MDD4194574.1 hypothetical protein [Acholeplasmataceae bacterium]